MVLQVTSVSSSSSFVRSSAVPKHPGEIGITYPPILQGLADKAKKVARERIQITGNDIYSDYEFNTKTAATASNGTLRHRLNREEYEFERVKSYFTAQLIMKQILRVPDSPENFFRASLASSLSGKGACQELSDIVYVELMKFSIYSRIVTFAQREANHALVICGDEGGILTVLEDKESTSMSAIVRGLENISRLNGLLFHIIDPLLNEAFPANLVAFLSSKSCAYLKKNKIETYISSRTYKLTREGIDDLERDSRELYKEVIQEKNRGYPMLRQSDATKSMFNECRDSIRFLKINPEIFSQYSPEEKARLLREIIESAKSADGSS